VAESADKPPPDAILQKVLEAVPVRLITDGVRRALHDPADR
jgi:hypothetical protein